MCEVIHIPARFLAKPYTDPREQDVADPYATPTADSIATAKAQCATERQLAGVCVGCGVPMKRHFTISGQMVGCEAAAASSALPRDPVRYNDPYAGLTLAVRRALVQACGPHMEIHMHRYSNDEQLALASVLVRTVLGAHAQEAKP